jgi:uncharacterized membrane protein
METTQPTAVSPRAGADGDLVKMVYILYIVGFFVGFTALAGVIVAVVNRGSASDIERAHFSFQIRLFVRGVVMLLLAAGLYPVVTAIVVGVSWTGVLLYAVPAGMIVWFYVGTIMAVARGMGALSRKEAIVR